MRDILSGGVLVTHVAIGPFLRKAALSRRQRPIRERRNARPLLVRADKSIQPGQLSSPRLQFGFPSLLVH